MDSLDPNKAGFGCQKGKAWYIYRTGLQKADLNAKQERLAYAEERLDCNKAGLNAKQARLANMMRKDFAIMSA